MSTTGEVPLPKRLRSSFTPFNWKENCMFCSKSVVVDLRHPERTKVGRVSTIPIRSRILECCQERRDEWAAEVENRILSCIDLVAAEAVYHDFCRT